MIFAGNLSQANLASGDWVFVDIGFASAAKSCGFLFGSDQPEDITFSELKARLQAIVRAGNNPLNLLIEAPLSVSFNDSGNPTGRSVEKRGSDTRYWYVSPGCSVLVAATYLLRSIQDTKPKRDIRLFEGLASFKPKGVKTKGSEDVKVLRGIIEAHSMVHTRNSKGEIVDPRKLQVNPEDVLSSAFLVAGMDFGIPPVVVVT